MYQGTLHWKKQVKPSKSNVRKIPTYNKFEQEVLYAHYNALPSSCHRKRKIIFTTLNCKAQSTESVDAHRELRRKSCDKA